MNKVQAYLEAVVKDGFDREIGQDENVVRSLPFFATSLGVLASSFALARPSLCAPAAGVLSLSIYMALSGLAGSAAGTIVFLLRLATARRYVYPMPEDEFIGRAIQIRAALEIGAPAEGEGDEETREEQALDELRGVRIEQLTEATRLNRLNNAARSRARGWALTMLICAIGFAFLLLALIFVRDTFAPESCHAGRP